MLMKKKKKTIKIRFLVHEDYANISNWRTNIIAIVRGILIVS
jgi:hypothetical protein